jgi:hypothetical protein
MRRPVLEEGHETRSPVAFRIDAKRKALSALAPHASPDKDLI